MWNFIIATTLEKLKRQIEISLSVRQSVQNLRLGFEIL